MVDNGMDIAPDLLQACTIDETLDTIPTYICVTF